MRGAFFDYLHSAKLLYRLNQVVSRIKLGPLPESTSNVISRGREIVEHSLPELLPAEFFKMTKPLKENLR